MGEVSDDAAPGRRDSLPRLIALHLLPGVVITAIYLAGAPVAERLGYPPLMALLVAAVVGVGFLQTGHLLASGYRRNGRLSLAGVVTYRDPMAWWKYLLFVPGLVVLCGTLVWLLTPVDGFIAEHVFAWLPSWYFYGDLDTYQGFSRDVLVVTVAARFVVDGVVLPVIEELYFRGHLLPRLERYGRWAPVINHGLFTIYHFWQPFNFVTIGVGLFPFVWLAWYRRNVKLAIAFHMIVNLIGALGMAGYLLGTR